MELDIKTDTCVLAVLPSEEQLNKLVESKTEKIYNEFTKLDVVQNMSKDSINAFFDSIIQKIMEWKFETLKELEAYSNSQKILLFNQKRKIEDAKGILFSVLHNLQQIKEKNCSTDLEKNYVSKLCLQKLRPLLYDLSQMKEPTSSIVEYVQNESFIKNLFCDECRLKIGHFESVSVSANDFELMPEGYLKLDTVVSFKVVFCDLRKDLDRIIKYFKWKVEVNGRKVETNHSFIFKTFRFEFLIKEMNVHTISFHLLNEHVSGSPFSFMPFSPSSVDILNGNSGNPTNPPPNSPTNEVDVLYKVIPRCTPEKSNGETFSLTRFKNLPSPGTPLRRPFKKLDENKTENGLSALANNDANFDFDFHPSFTSTGTELITRNLHNLNIREDDSIGFDRSADQSSLKPGFKTILMDQVIIKNGHDESDSDSQLKINMESKPSVVRNLSNSDWDIPFSHTSQPKCVNFEQKIDDCNLNENIIDCVQKRLVAKFECKFLEDDNSRLKEPMGIAQLKSKEIVVSNTLANQMLLFNADGRFLCEFGSSSILDRPSTIVVLPDGKFAVKNKREIIMFSPKLLYLFTIGTNFLIKPFGLATDGRGNLITVEVAVPIEISILFIDSSGQLIKKVPVRGLSEQQLWESQPRFVGYWASVIYVGDTGLDQFHLIEAGSGVLLNSFGSFGTNDGEFDHPSAVTFDSEGFLIVADRKNNRIQVFTPSGSFVGVLRIDRPLKAPTGLHLSEEGHLYVLNCLENSLVKYSIQSE